MGGEGKGLVAAPDLAARMGLSLPTVSKILKQLTKSGIVAAQRGIAGGYRLAGDPAHISIAAVIEAMDGPIAITDCAHEGVESGCAIETVCPMSGNWTKVNHAIRQALEGVTLADMAAASPRQRIRTLETVQPVMAEG
jgi:FeS assembly SUF system regulator